MYFTSVLAERRVKFKPYKQYNMSLKDVLSILFGLKQPELIPIPVNNDQKKS